MCFSPVLPPSSFFLFPSSQLSNVGLVVDSQIARVDGTCCSILLVEDVALAAEGDVACSVTFGSEFVAFCIELDVARSIDDDDGIGALHLCIYIPSSVDGNLGIPLAGYLLDLHVARSVDVDGERTDCEPLAFNVSRSIDVDGEGRALLESFIEDDVACSVDGDVGERRCHDVSCDGWCVLIDVVVAAFPLVVL